MTRVLVLGAGGQMGRAIMACPARDGLEFTGMDRAACDIADASGVENAIARVRPDIVINTAAMTAVDKAEQEPQLAMLMNRDGAANVAKACVNHGATLIHLSTDYVFGNAPGRPFVETDTPAPLNTYGQSKALGEDAIRDILPQHVILRTAWVYGPNSANFFMTMMRLAETMPSLKVVKDEHSCPTFADHLADTILNVTQQIATGGQAFGTFHACGRDGVSRLEFAQAIMDARAAVGLKAAQLTPTTQAAFNAPALRPVDSRMDCAALETSYGCRLKGLFDTMANLVAQLAAEARP